MWVFCFYLYVRQVIGQHFVCSWSTRIIIYKYQKLWFSVKTVVCKNMTYSISIFLVYLDLKLAVALIHLLLLSPWMGSQSLPQPIPPDIGWGRIHPEQVTNSSQSWQKDKQAHSYYGQWLNTYNISI